MVSRLRSHSLTLYQELVFDNFEEHGQKKVRPRFLMYDLIVLAGKVRAWMFLCAAKVKEKSIIREVQHKSKAQKKNSFTLPQCGKLAFLDAYRVNVDEICGKLYLC